MKLDGCNALITGASAGIGEEFARQLADRTASLVLVARRVDRLEALRDEMKRRNPSLQVYVRGVDLSKQVELDDLCDWIEREKITINFLINNAGLGDTGRFVTSDSVRVKEVLLVNVFALTLLTRRLLPTLVAQKQSAILNVSSSAGFLPIPEAAIYAASKAYVTSFSEALRTELRHTSVTVTALCPGPVNTEFAGVSRRAGEHAKKTVDLAHVPVERVVGDALAGVEANRPIIIPGIVMKIAMTVVRLMPMPLLRFIGKIAYK
jgi:short-subunit dehydrogenase